MATGGLERGAQPGWRVARTSELMYNFEQMAGAGSSLVLANEGQLAPNLVGEVERVRR